MRGVTAARLTCRPCAPAAFVGRWARLSRRGSAVRSRVPFPRNRDAFPAFVEWQILGGENALAAPRLVAPIRLAAAVLHRPSSLASVPGLEAARPVKARPTLQASVVRTGAVAQTIVIGRRDVAGIGTEIQVDLLCRCRSSNTEHGCSGERRDQNIPHGSLLFCHSFQCLHPFVGWTLSSVRHAGLKIW